MIYSKNIVDVSGLKSGSNRVNQESVPKLVLYVMVQQYFGKILTYDLF